MGRYAVTIAGLLLLLVAFGCSAGSPQLTPPPDGTGDDVIIPPELQAEYSRLVQANDPGLLPVYFSNMSVTERRALSLYMYDRWLYPGVPFLYLICRIEDQEECRQLLIEEITPQIPGSGIGYDDILSNPEGEDIWGFELGFGATSKGILAWYGDQIVKSYSDRFLFAWIGEVNVPAGLDLAD